MLALAIALGVLTVARLTRLLVEDRLTVAYRRWVVNRFGEDSMPSYLVHCPWCMSIWVSLIVMPIAVLLPSIWTLAILAVPAASMLTGLLLERKE